MIIELINEIKQKIDGLIESENIDAVGFISPIVNRNIQFMAEFEKIMQIERPHLKITKVKLPNQVPQKTLSHPEDRINNAKTSFVVEENRYFKNVLLIDDFVDFGSSLNYVAGKYKRKFDKKIKIIGFAICGSPNGVINNSKKLEVINEV